MSITKAHRQEIRQLKRRQGRVAQRKVLVEGEKCIRELCRSAWTVERIYFTETWEGASIWTSDAHLDSLPRQQVSAKDMEMMYRDIAALKRGETIDQPVYDFAAHDRKKGEFETVVPKRVTIVEGIHVLSDPAIAELFDLKVYVDTPDDLRLARRILRDTAPEDQGGRGRSVDRVISQYLNFVRPTHHRVTGPHKYIADLVIADEGLPAFTTSRPTRHAVMRMLAPVRNWLEDRGIVKSDDFSRYPDDTN